MTALRIAYLEPFYGGSHKSFVDGLMNHSRHRIELFSLSDRFWKWRTRGAAPAFYQQLPNPTMYDIIVASDMVNLAELQGLWKTSVPLVQYIHENQLTYPLEDGDGLDANYVMTDLLSMLVADRVVFNSVFHKNAFLQAAQIFSSRMPDCRPGWMVRQIEAKSTVLYPGVDFPEQGAVKDMRRYHEAAGPVMLWNHRWEYDKQPEAFVQLLHLLRAQGTPFSLVLLGDRAASSHPSMLEIERDFASQVLFGGYAQTVASYQQWLSRADIVISCAIQENFGIAAVEAMFAGCFPLFPNRLSYPEIVPPTWRARCLYHDMADCAARIAAWQPMDITARNELKQHCEQFSTSQAVPQYDLFFETVIGQRCEQ